MEFNLLPYTVLPCTVLPYYRVPYYRTTVHRHHRYLLNENTNDKKLFYNSPSPSAEK